MITEDDSEDDDNDSEGAACEKRSDVGLKSGSYPKECDSSSDCELENGANGDCECSFDGKKYCVPHKADLDIFPFLDDICKDGKLIDGMQKEVLTMVQGIYRGKDSIDCWDEFEDAAFWKKITKGNGGDDDDSAAYLVAAALLAFF